jgi:hypothetical protein
MCGTEEIGAGNVSNVQGKSVARRMTHVVGSDSVHGSVQSNKLRATTWAGPIHFGMGIDAWTRGGGFLGGHSSIGVI